MDISFATAERIRLKKAQYCRFIDTKQWRSFEKLAFPDARFTFYGVNNEVLYDFSSTEELIRPTARLLEHARSSHRVCNSELCQISDREIAAIWAMEDYLVFPAQDGKAGRAMRGYGHYHEIWTQRGQDWFLKKLELRRQVLSSFALGSGGTQTEAETAG
jgi:hypothetical protein